MKDKIIIRISNNLGNQMFMYASAFALAKKLNRELFVDNETAYNVKNNIYKYDLDIFNINSKKAPDNLKFLGSSGYIRRKAFKYFDKFNYSKKFYIEPKDKKKNTLFNTNFFKGNFKSSLFVEGHFETEKYFEDYNTQIKKEFSFKNIETYKKTKIYSEIKNSNSVSICVRQNRFSERKRPITNIDDNNSNIFSNDQIKYIQKAIILIKSKINNPKFFLWSNDHKNLNNYFPPNEYVPVSTNKIDFDLFLMTQAKHFIVIPSSFNWWGAWLGTNMNRLILRPADNHFTNFKLNNKDFWPETWIKV